MHLRKFTEAPEQNSPRQLSWCSAKDEKLTREAAEYAEKLIIHLLDNPKPCRGET